MRSGERGLQRGDLVAPLALLIRELGGEFAHDVARRVACRCGLAGAGPARLGAELLDAGA